MKVTKEISIANYDAREGAIETQDLIFNNDKVTEFDNLIEELYPDGIDDTALNDLLWFESDWICEMLGIDTEDEEDDDEEE